MYITESSCADSNVSATEIMVLARTRDNDDRAVVLVRDISRFISKLVGAATTEVVEFS